MTYETSKILNQGNDLYLQSQATVVLDEENDALRHFITHMSESLGQALKMESERAQADFSYNIQSIINRHVTDINDYINANIHNLIKDKE